MGGFKKIARALRKGSAGREKNFLYFVSDDYKKCCAIGAIVLSKRKSLPDNVNTYIEIQFGVDLDHEIVRHPVNGKMVSLWNALVSLSDGAGSALDDPIVPWTFEEIAVWLENYKI